jgi:hypothetical protein
MSLRNNHERKANLAIAIAAGKTVADWARDNAIPDRTARTWSHSQEVRDQVEAIRRAVIDRTIGRLSDHATEAADQIARLAKDAASEAVRLQAARAVLAELMAVSNYDALEQRLAQVERSIAHAQHAEHGTTHRTG